MEEINTQLADLNVLYKLFQEKPNKQTSASFRKGLMKLKNSSHSLRKNVLLSIKPKSVEPAELLAPVVLIETEVKEQVEPPAKKVKRSKSSKKQKPKITKEKAPTVKFN